MDVDSTPSAGPSRLQGMDTDNEGNPNGDHDSEGEYDNEEDEEEEEYVERLTITHTGCATPSRSASADASIASGGREPIDPYPWAPRCNTPRTFKLLYVPDPSHESKGREHVSHDLGWVKQNLTKGQLAAIKEMKDFHVKARAAEDLATEGSTYRLTEWVSGHLVCIYGAWCRCLT